MSMRRVLLKRHRSPSPDDETKPTIRRSEKKKPRLMASEIRPKPSAGKQRFLRLLHKQKAAVTPLTLGNSSIAVSFSTVASTSDMASAVPASGSEICTESEFISHYSVAGVPETARVDTSGWLESFECGESSSVNPWSRLDSHPALLRNEPFDYLSRSRDKLDESKGSCTIQIPGTIDIVPLDEPAILHEPAASKGPEPDGTSIYQNHVATSQGTTGVTCPCQRQSEMGNVDAPSGESVTEPVNQTVKPFDEQISVQPSEVPSFLAWKSRRFHVQRLRRLRWIPYELKRASPGRKKDNAKIKYKLKMSPEEHTGPATTHSPKARLPAMLPDDANTSSQLRTTDGAVPSFTCSSGNASVVLIPDTPLPCLPGPPVQLQTSSKRLISNNGVLPPGKSAIFSNGAIVHVPSATSCRETISTDEPPEVAAPSASLVPFTLQDSDFPNAGVDCIDIAVIPSTLHAPPSDTYAPFISIPSPDHVESVIEEMNVAIIPADEMSGFPASTLHLQCVGSRSEFSQAEVALPTVLKLLNNQDVDLFSSSSSVGLVSEIQPAFAFGDRGTVSPFLSDSAASSSYSPILTISHVEPITELGAVTSYPQAEPATLSAPLATVLPPAVPSILDPSPSAEPTDAHLPFVHFQQTPKHVTVQHISDSRDVPHQVDAPHSISIPQGTDMPYPMDVDIANDWDDNQARSHESATYHYIKSQPLIHSQSDMLAKIGEMLAAAKSPTPRLPKSLREQGRARQYDVPRADNQLKSCVREYAHHLLGQMPWDVPLESELLAFRNGRAPGPTAMSFRLDLASQGLASRWNTQAAEIFADAFLNEDELAREFSDREQILSAFVVHLVTLQKCYRQPILHANMMEAEINGERDKQKQKAREQRKRGLFRRRINATKDYEADPLLKNLLALFWPYCTPEAMSDDETDSEWDGPADQFPHFIKIMNWRNPDVVNFFRVFDALYFSTRFKGNKWSPGRFPHARVPSVRRKECDAIPGLPVNFYCPQWLCQLGDIERRKLNTRPSIDLDFSQNVLRIAARFLHIRQRKQLPLPRDHPALQGITKSAYPAGFPLDDQLDRVSNEEEVVLITHTPEPMITAVPDVQKNPITSRLSQPLQGATPQSTAPALTVPKGVSPTTLTTPNSTYTPSELNCIPLHPVPAVSLAGLPGENSSRPQFFFVNQQLQGGSRFPGSYRVALEAVAAGSGSTQLHGILHVPAHSGHPIGSVPQSLDINPSPITGQKPFTLRKHPRKFTQKFDKGKGKGS